MVRIGCGVVHSAGPAWAIIPVSMPRRLAVASWSLRPSTPEHLVSLMAETGLARVQIALSRVIRDPAWSCVFESLRQSGVEIVSGMMEMRGEDYTSLESIRRTGGVRPDDLWTANLGHAHEVASLAADQGITLVTFHAGAVPGDHGAPEWPVMVDRLRELASAFRERGVALALETGQERAATMTDLLAAVGDPGLGINFDPANMILYGSGDPIAALGALAPHIRQVHIKDAVPSGEPGVTWGTERRVGNGSVHWGGFFDRLSAIARPLNLVIEREAGDDRIGDIRRAAEVVREHLPTVL